MSNNSQLLESIVSGGLDQGTQNMVRVVREADGSEVEMLAQWLDFGLWRSFESKEFWFYVYFLILRFGQPQHIGRLRAVHATDVDSKIDEFFFRMRNRVADWIEYRAQPKARGAADESLPTTKAAIMAHIEGIA